MQKTSVDFQIFIKPVGAICNLFCTYCYYLDKSTLYNKRDQGRMSDEILELYISRHLAASGTGTVMFSWHGGEPTLAGIDFYKKALAFQKKYSSPDQEIINGIQTNGILLDDKWCRFFADENFYVGISIDGPEHLHNKFRKTRDGRYGFKQCLDAYFLLQKYKVNCEVLCVLNSYNVDYPLEVYNFFKGLGVRYISFLPLVNRKPGTFSGLSDESVSALSFGRFLCTVFDEWKDYDIGNIKIQIFEEAARTAFGQDHTLCIFKKTCGSVPVIEKNGDFYSCDHFVDKEHLIGNIQAQTITEMLESPFQTAFGQAKLDTLPMYCKSCDVRDMCNGECPKNRFISTPDGEEGLNYLCEGYKLFFRHCRPFVQELASLWKSIRDDKNEIL